MISEHEQYFWSPYNYIDIGKNELVRFIQGIRAHFVFNLRRLPYAGGALHFGPA